MSTGEEFRENDLHAASRVGAVARLLGLARNMGSARAEHNKDVAREGAVICIQALRQAGILTVDIDPAAFDAAIDEVGIERVEGAKGQKALARELSALEEYDLGDF